MDMDVDIVHGLVDDNLGVTSRTDISSSINKKLPIRCCSLYIRINIINK